MRTPQEQANIRLVERIYEEVLGPIDSQAVDGLFAPGYIQHNPSIPSGAMALKDMLDRAKGKYPNAVHIVKRMMADGDLVMASRRRRRGNPVRLASATGAPMDRHGASCPAMTI